MFGPIVYAPVLLLVLLASLFLAAWRRWRPLEVDPSRLAEVQAAHRKAIGWRWAGFGVGVVAAGWTASAWSLGRGLMLAPTVFGLCVIAGVFVGELATTPRREGIRTAALETRRVGRYLPRRLGGLVIASTASLGALLVTTSLMGSADDLGRAGRSLFRQCGPDSASGSGPWPGLFYSVPLGIAVAIGLLVAGVALRTVVLRPRDGSASDLVAADDLLRERSAEAVVAAIGVMVAGSLLGVAVIAGGALTSLDCPPTSWVILGSCLMAVAVFMVLLLAWCLALLLTGPRIRAAESGDTAVAAHRVAR